MNETMRHPWEPKLTSYPTLILDDHATEWASRITDDDTERIEVDGEEIEAVRPAMAGEFSSTEDGGATERREPSNTQDLGDYVPDRVLSGDVASGLC